MEKADARISGNEDRIISEYVKICCTRCGGTNFIMRNSIANARSARILFKRGNS